MAVSEKAIFISYRRADSADITDRIDDHLRLHFGARAVFKDVRDIPPGSDFVEELQDRISGCRVILIIIGGNWVNITGQDGERRIERIDDPVRMEVEAALREHEVRSDLTVLPVVVGAASHPSKDDLPGSLGKLHRLNHVRVRRDPDFRGDIEKLIEAIESSTPELRPGARAGSLDPGRRSMLARAAVPLTLVAVAGLALSQLMSPSTSPVLIQLTGMGMSSSASQLEVFIDEHPVPRKPELGHNQWGAAGVTSVQHLLNVQFPYCKAIERTFEATGLEGDQYYVLSVPFTTTCDVSDIDFSLIPAHGVNEYTVGVEGTERSVLITFPVMVQQTEFTAGHHQLIMGAPFRPADGCEAFAFDADTPLHCISFSEVATIANAWSEKEDLEPCYTIEDDVVRWPRGVECPGFRLPTEAEWEYFATLGRYNTRDSSAYPGGHVPQSVGWFDFNSEQNVHPVKGLDPTHLGLYDLGGNVAEWVWDWHAPIESDALVENPVGPDQGTRRVTRGGSWRSLQAELRATARGRADPARPSNRVGFRLVRSFTE